MPEAMTVETIVEADWQMRKQMGSGLAITHFI